MSDDRQQTFWVANEDTFVETLEFVKRQPGDAATALFNLRQDTTNQKNAIAHLTRCAARGCRRRDALEKELAGERIEIQRCEKTIADLRAEVERLKAKREKK